MRFDISITGAKNEAKANVVSYVCPCPLTLTPFSAHTHFSDQRPTSYHQIYPEVYPAYYLPNQSIRAETKWFGFGNLQSSLAWVS